MQEEKRKNIVDIFLKNPSWSIALISKEAGAAKSTVQGVLQRYKITLSTSKSEGSGRKKGPLDPKHAKRVISTLKRNPELSNRDVAKKLGCSHYYVYKIKKENGLKSYKKMKVPDRTLLKNAVAKSRIRKLYDEHVRNVACIVLDDETYVKLDFKQLPGQEFYVAKNRGGVAKKYTTIQTAKFAKKMMIWQAICSCGLKSAYFVTDGTINTNVYIEECLKKRLLPFLKKHNKTTLFWPDLATCHYSNATVAWYVANGVNFVPKNANPPNCPEIRPIEKYWAIVKKILKKTRNSARDKRDLGKKWSAAAKKVSEGCVQDMMSSMRSKIRDIARGGEMF